MLYDMKRLRVVIFFLLGLFGELSAEEMFSSKFELVKPTGKIDSTSYFQCTLTNQSDTAVVIHAGEVGTGMPTVSFFRYEFEKEDGSKRIGSPSNGFLFFDSQNRKKPIMILHPKESVKMRIPLFIESFDIYNGVFSRKEENIRGVKKIRVRLEKFQYMNQVTVEFVEDKTLLSNWVEVDADAVVALLRKKLKK